MGVASSTVYLLGVFMQPLEREFGWSRAEISSGMTIASVVSVFSAPLMGYVIDRVGARRIAILGVTLFCTAIACFRWRRRRCGSGGACGCSTPPAPRR
jgi:MFS family permease